jgi:hypothetical protein
MYKRKLFRVFVDVGEDEGGGVGDGQHEVLDLVVVSMVVYDFPLCDRADTLIVPRRLALLSSTSDWISYLFCIMSKTSSLE